MINTIPIEVVDRTIYEHLRLMLVRLGYLPDITLYSTQEAYQQAKDNLPTLVELVGDSSAEERGSKSVNSITITRKAVGKGSIGAGGLHQYRPKLGKFIKELLPTKARNVDYEIRLAVTSKDLESELSNHLWAFLDIYIQVPEELKDLTDVGGFSLFVEDEVNLTTTNYREKLYKVSTSDLWLGVPRIVRENISPLTEVEVRIGIKDLAGSKVIKDFVVKAKD